MKLHKTKANILGQTASKGKAISNQQVPISNRTVDLPTQAAEIVS